MKIHLQVDGGFAALPGLSRPFCVDVDAMPADEAAAWRAAVERTDFFDRQNAPPEDLHPDGRAFTVTVDDASRSRTLTFADRRCDAAVGTLLRMLQERQRAERRNSR